MQSIEIPPAFAERITRALGEAGAAWLRDLPTMVQDFERRWEMTVGSPFGLSFNYVARARLADGTGAVFKISPPWGDGEAEREIEALREYGGRGICRLLAADRLKKVMLLERLRPGEMLLTAATLDDDAATRIGADVMQQLWRPTEQLTEPTRYKPLAEWFEAFPRHRAAYNGPGPFPLAILERAEAIVRHLLASAPCEVLLHGDFHHYNVLSSDRAPWLAIDPKGMLGDPGYEIGPFLLNPHGPPKRAGLLARRLDLLAEVLRYDRARLREWGIAYAVLSACWSAEGFGDGWQDALVMAQTLIDL